MIYSCLEDVELALEEVIDQIGLSPLIQELSEDKKLSAPCQYCGARALYIVTNIHSDT